ncbi:MAG: rhomboid family intramembrane serine protease [Bdellovibrionaceae bacterium]|nr:rhomboid family intramembrane serine protease [Pseudobdellovibrionaceae bacterium]
MLKRDRVGALQKDAYVAYQNYNPWIAPLLVSSEHDQSVDRQFHPRVAGYLFFLILLFSFIAFKRQDVLMWMIHSNKGPLWRQLITTVTHFFIHADWVHLLGNLLFFGIFAHGVEKKIGSIEFLKLIGLSLISYSVFQIFWYGQQQVYSLGASVGIAACMAYYITADPYRPFRFIIHLPRYAFNQRRYYVLVIPAWIFLVVYILKEVFGLKAQIAGHTNIAHSGHLVGIFVGLFFYTISPPPPQMGELSGLASHS